MNKKAAKVEVVKELRESLSAASIVIVSKNHGVTVGQVNNLRRSMKAANSTYLVAKNTLTKLALRDTKFSSLSELLSGPVTLSYSDDPVAVAKTLKSFCKENDKLQICGAVMDEKVLSVNEVEILADLPSLDELRSKIIGLISAPASKIARVVQAPATKVARVLQAYASK